MRPPLPGRTIDRVDRTWYHMQENGVWGRRRIPMALLSVIIPSFNEESNIRNTVDTLSAVLQREHIAYELLFVSDGSKDQTFPLIRSASLQDLSLIHI